MNATEITKAYALDAVKNPPKVSGEGTFKLVFPKYALSLCLEATL